MNTKTASLSKSDSDSYFLFQSVGGFETRGQLPMRLCCNLDEVPRKL